ncbi:MAG: S8 family peptidase, partial [Microlunatus sp.]|nr:S8 family peptidase [Microlunatus sp.]
MVGLITARFSTRSRLAGGFAALLCGAVALGLTPTASADPPTTPEVPVPSVASTPGRYIVTLATAPIAAYDGGVSGIAATRPSAGRRVDVTSSNAKRYRAYLRKQQDKVAARVGAKPRSRFEIGLTAFTATMTGQQAKTLANTPGVLSVTKDTLRKATDNKNSVDYLKLSGQNGVWAKLGGIGKSGRGVVVGVLDTGIWPESASFAGSRLGTSASGKFVPYRSGRTIKMAKSDGGTFSGICQTGQDFTRNDCSTKIVGARYFGDAWQANVPAADRRDYISPRDGGGHGSHTAGTAVGNHGVTAVVDGRDFGKISGVAPAAKVAAYKVLWEGKTAAQSGGFTTDILDAIEAAITDGVDVINYSISGGDDPTDPVELAFLSAASAGIFVSASAGNSGPGASTLAHTSPWVTTVGASTIAPYYGTVSLGNGRKYAGISTSVTAPVGPAPLATAASLVAAGQTATDATLCLADSLDPAKTAGKIVVCDRGAIARVDKSAEVKRAGGIGMVLANLTENSLDGDLHTVPTVHVNPPASTAIKTYAATPGATATLTQGNQSSTSIPYPQIAGFSSRGPSLGTGGDTLKPDIVAPGVAILAAVAPPSNSGRNFDFYSGTSMAAPHVAGLAALYFGAGVHPKWSAMRVKSALMTTAHDVKDDQGRRVTDPYAQGAGEVYPEKMLNPGLVYPSGDKDWLGYLE